MSYHSFWLLFLRALGLTILILGINVFFVYFQTAFWFIQSGDLAFIIILLLVAGFYFFIAYALVLKPTISIKLFRLTEDITEEKIETKNSLTTLLRLAVIILGGFLFIDSIPTLLATSIDFFYTDLEFFESSHKTQIIILISKIIIGYFMISYSKNVVSFLEKRMIDDSDLIDKKDPME